MKDQSKNDPYSELGSGRVEKLLKSSTIAAVSLVPGGPFVAGILGLIATPLEKRQAQFINQIASRLENLEQAQIVDIEELAGDPVFVTTLVQALNIAFRNHQEEKLAALRNAVINVALKIDVDDEISSIFLGFIDKFTPSHIRILHTLNMVQNGMLGDRDLYDFLSRNFDSENGQLLLSIIAKELGDNNLILSPPSSTLHLLPTFDLWKQQGGMHPTVTSIGERFIKFVI